jgi:hypothetical protein
MTAKKKKNTLLFIHTDRHAVERSERKKGNTGIETNRERLMDD